MPSLEPLLSIREVAAYLGVSIRTVYNLCARGDLPHIRLNNTTRITRADLERFVEGRRAR